jgi:hypothetical protein
VREEEPFRIERPSTQESPKKRAKHGAWRVGISIKSMYFRHVGRIPPEDAAKYVVGYLRSKREA